MKISRIFIAALIAAFARESLAQGFPSDDAISAQMKAIEAQRKAVFGAVVSSETQSKLPMPAAPNLPTPKPAGISIEQLASKYQQKPAQKVAADSYEVAIFISLSMPIESIQRFAQHANKIGGMLLIRGFKDDSLRATTEAVRGLGIAKANLQINPAAFTKYKINAVPAVVVTRTDAATRVDGEGCALPETYAGIYGDVTLAYALEQIGMQAPEFRQPVQGYVKKLRGDL